MKRSSAHDAYIHKAADFAVPILTRIRTAIHKACPEVQETIKWGTPHFEHEGLLAGMAAFKAHVNFIFWKGRKLSDEKGLLTAVGKTGMGLMRIEKLSDLPSERVLVQYTKEAARLNETGERAPRNRGTTTAKKAKAKKQLAAPSDLMAALRKRRKALATFEGFSHSHRKDYVEWITEAKRDATRDKRIETAVEWLAEGKPRNWKYMKGWR